MAGILEAERREDLVPDGVVVLELRLAVATALNLEGVRLGAGEVDVQRPDRRHIVRVKIVDAGLGLGERAQEPLECHLLLGLQRELGSGRIGKARAVHGHGRAESQVLTELLFRALAASAGRVDRRLQVVAILARHAVEHDLGHERDGFHLGVGEGKGSGRAVFEWRNKGKRRS